MECLLALLLPVKLRTLKLSVGVDIAQCEQDLFITSRGGRDAHLWHLPVVERVAVGLEEVRQQKSPLMGMIPICVLTDTILPLFPTL